MMGKLSNEQIQPLNPFTSQHCSDQQGLIIVLDFIYFLSMA